MRLLLALGSIPELQYRDGERDMVVMHHRLTTRTIAGERWRRTATLVLQGAETVDGISAMSLTTGGMLAIGAQLMLAGKIEEARESSTPRILGWPLSFGRNWRKREIAS